MSNSIVIYTRSDYVTIVKSRRTRREALGETVNAYIISVWKHSEAPLLEDEEGTVRIAQYCCVSDWIGLAQDRNRWRALVNSVMNV
jgi:hypothetical protein